MCAQYHECTLPLIRNSGHILFRILGNVHSLYGRHMLRYRIADTYARLSGI